MVEGGWEWLNCFNHPKKQGLSGEFQKVKLNNTLAKVKVKQFLTRIHGVIDYMTQDPHLPVQYMRCTKNPKKKNMVKGRKATQGKPTFSPSLFLTTS